MKRSTSLPLLAVVAVLALALGSVGTAVAGPALTKGAVKKIAAKVVKKAAPKLSVAHAASADSATTLGGQPATAFQTNVTVYTVGISPATNSITVPIPLTIGKYLVSYSVYLGAPTAADCYISKGLGVNFTKVGEESADAPTYSPGLSATSYVDVVPGMVVSLECLADVAFTTHASEPIQIVVQKVDSAVVGQLTPRPPDGRDRRARWLVSPPAGTGRRPAPGGAGRRPAAARAWRRSAGCASRRRRG